MTHVGINPQQLISVNWLQCTWDGINFTIATISTAYVAVY